MFVEVIINNNAKALNRTFDYSVPKELENLVHIGSRVSIQNIFAIFLIVLN